MIRKGVLSVALLCAAAAAQTPSVNIGVFGLFHPAALTVQPASGDALSVHIGGQTFTLDSDSVARLEISGASIDVAFGDQHIRVAQVLFTARDGDAGDIILAVPAQIHRQFHGRVLVRSVAGELVPVVEMDLETAVASVVAAESPPGAPLEALKAQAVVTRSFFMAGAQHRDFDFCDTTHCQFLREPPPETSLAWQATRATRGIVLQYEGHTLAAMYSAACGGHTRTLQEAGFKLSAYPYHGVRCDYCLRHRHNGQQGHGVGLCQRGAAGMAAAGSGYREILAHYFPNTTLRG